MHGAMLLTKSIHEATTWCAKKSHSASISATEELEKRERQHKHVTGASNGDFLKLKNQVKISSDQSQQLTQKMREHHLHTLNSSSSAASKHHGTGTNPKSRSTSRSSVKDKDEFLIYSFKGPSKDSPKHSPRRYCCSSHDI